MKIKIILCIISILIVWIGCRESDEYDNPYDEEAPPAPECLFPLPDTVIGTNGDLLAALMGFGYLAVSVTAALPVLMARNRLRSMQNGDGWT